MSTTPKPRSNAQKAADAYNGSQHVLVAVYQTEFIVYAQVSHDTAHRLIDALIEAAGITYTTPGNDHAALSSDGMTHVWIFERSRLSDDESDWLVQIMNRAAPAIERTCNHVLVDGGIMYVDNRYKDHNTVELYCTLLE